ncbi:MAG: DUF1800 domain-containing protein, partial [Saprospiraceae bacterium]|nr:DUF1800 domain-containing protein [Saprospiraceae bacterium]
MPTFTERIAPFTATASRAQTAAPTVQDPLMPYVPSAAKPWNARRVAHLYRRLGFGASHAQIQAGLQLSPGDLIDQILDTAADRGSPDPPFWGAWTMDDYANIPDPNLVFIHRDELRRRWLAEMLDEGIQAKMALFWHNHFVTELDVYGCNAYLWSYYAMIHEYAFGNFRIFAREMGKTGAMLVYLNGNLSLAGAPNENYARELMELFTMGESNGYTQADIVAMSRALTGWRASDYLCDPPYFDPNRHDNTPKTIFGETSNFGYTTAHNLVFSARANQVSHYIVGKLYKHFVYQNIDNEVVTVLAQTFRDNNWEILPVLKQLIKSEHFFEETFLNVQHKSPLESMLNLYKAVDTPASLVSENRWNAIGYWSYQLGQELFNPPNVAGWKGHRNWINESTLTARWNYSAAVAYWLTTEEQSRENLRTLAQTLTNDSNDPSLITAALVEFLTGQSLD